MTALEVLRRHRAEVVQLAQMHGVNDIHVFGSVARGDADDASDIDRYRTDTRAPFDADERTQVWMVNRLQIIGEAAWIF